MSESERYGPLDGLPQGHAVDESAGVDAPFAANLVERSFAEIATKRRGAPARQRELLDIALSEIHARA
ncbi:MAG: hypothetical protein KJZ80_11520 [Hyphomicrobiaceae bacterium]|nr:hypothetical protein [Hyphomicrobiaceae bacterium]